MRRSRPRAARCGWAMIASMSGHSVGVAQAQPGPRTSHTMAYDPHRGVTVLFGGLEGCDPGSGALGDTWELDEHGWRLVATTGPRPWPSRGSAFDPIDRVIRTHIGAGDGTWDWDGLQWRHRGWQDVGGDYWVGLAYDEHRQRMVIHGGYPSVPKQASSHTSEWDGSRWVFITETGPSFWVVPANLVYDVRRKVCVAYGSQDKAGFVHEWDGDIWRSRAIEGPLRRTGCAIAYDTRRSVMVMFAGYGTLSTEPLGDTWEFDGDKWRLVAHAGPTPRSNHTMAYDHRRGVTVLFGGWDGQHSLGDTWEWDGQTWREFAAAGCQADCDTSTGFEVLDIFDFLCFQNRFAAGSAYACDCDTSSGPGVCDILDFLCFQNQFAAGCP